MQKTSISGFVKSKSCVMVSTTLFFAHPKSFIPSKYERDLLLSKKYTENVVAIVLDKAHCILDWLV